MGAEWHPAHLTTRAGGPPQPSLTLAVPGPCHVQHVVGLRYAWRETPCHVYKGCPVYDASTGLPLGPFIRYGLEENVEKRAIGRDPVELV